MSARVPRGFYCGPGVCLIAAAAMSGGVGAQSGPAPGGFVEHASSTAVRPLVTAAQAQSFLPVRGPFTFPSPYNTQGVRLTNASDCNGQDCVLPVGYSYWNNINNHAGSDTMLVFLSLERRRGGAGPTLFSVHKGTGETRNLGPLFAAEHALSWSSGEGWYFSRTRPHALYVPNWSRLQRYDVQSRTLETVFDVASQYGSNRYLWQAHSSNDDRVHSATLRDTGSYEMLGCVAYREDRRQFFFYAKKGDFDECQVDKSGRWLVIKENVDGRNGEDNRIIDLETGAERTLLDENGAAGHSDVGYGYMTAEDNFHAKPGAVRVWRFDLDLPGSQPAVPGQGTLVYHLASWNSGLGHLAHGNARGDIAVDRQMVCSSNASREALPRVNEVVCYRLNDSLNALIVAPNLVDLNAAGGGSDDYWKVPKGNLDVSGEYFIWTANAGTSRLDAFIVRVPSRRLMGAAGQGPKGPSHLLGLVNGSQVSLSWTNPAPDGSATVLDVTGPVTASLTMIGETFSFAGVPPGTYGFSVRALSAAGSSASSNSVTLTFPGACAGPPQSPTDFEAVRSGSTITVRWSPPTAGPALAHYTVHVRGAFSGDFATMARAMSGTVAAGTYLVGVTATNACGTGPVATPVTMTIP